MVNLCTIGCFGIDLTESSVVGGQQNSVSCGRNSFIGSGKFNTGSAAYSSIVGGKQNYLSGGISSSNQKNKFIGGGTLNQVGTNNGGDNAQGYNSSIVGGFTNRVFGKIFAYNRWFFR